MIDTEHRDVPVCPHCGHQHARFNCLVPADEPGDCVGEGET